MALTDEEIRNRLEGLLKALDATTRASGVPRRRSTYR